MQNNNHYPNRHTITDASELAAVVKLDHVAATYLGDRRSSANFQSSNCVVMDIDNDHTDIDADWITPDGLAEIMAGVAFMTATSETTSGPRVPSPPGHASMSTFRSPP